MTYAIFFAAGFVVGLAVAVPVIALFWMGANKAAETKYKGQLLTAQVDLANAKKRVDASIAKLRTVHPDMSPEQERIAREQLNGDVFQARYTR